MSDNALFYVVSYIGNLLTLLAAAYTEIYLLKRRSSFALRVLIWGIGTVVVTAALIVVTILIPNEGVRGYFYAAASYSSVILVYVMLRFCYDANIGKSLFIACGAIIVRTLMLCECSLLLMLIGQEQTLGALDSIPALLVGYGFVLVSLAVWFLLPVRKRITVRSDSFLITNPVTLAILFAICFVLPIVLSQLYFVRDPLHRTEYFFVLLAEAVLCCVGLGVQHLITSQYRDAADREIADRLIRESEKRFADLKENMEIINIKCHDLRHRLRDYEEMNGTLTTEMRELTRAINIYDSRIQTGNETLDIVLSDHLLRASNKGVQLSAVADGNAVGFLETADLYSLFNNLLGNAMEYVETLPEENRFIRLAVRGAGGFVRIETENYFDGTLQYENGLPVSSKGGDEHGYGMKSIRRIVEKYRGSMEISTENGMFTAAIVLKQA